MATKPRVIDLDAQLGIEPNDEPIYIKTIKLLGDEWRVVCDLSSFSLSAVTSGEATAGDVMRFLESMIHPDDWPRFRSIASNHPALRGEQSAERMFEMIRAIVEVASERPTMPPSTSPRGVSNGSTGRKSAASTGSARAKGSTTSR